MREKTKEKTKDRYRDELIEEYIHTRYRLIQVQDRLFWAFVFLGLIGLTFLLILIFVGLRLDAIDFFSGMFGR